MHQALKNPSIKCVWGDWLLFFKKRGESLSMLVVDYGV